MAQDDSGDEDTRPLLEREKSKVWGRRPWADKKAKEILNDVSFGVLRDQPDYVDEPGDPSLSDLLEHHYGHEGTKAPTLVDLLGRGLNYQEAVVWYFFRFCGMSIMDIYYSTNRTDTGGGVQDRRNATRNIRRVLNSAARKMGKDISVPDPDDPSNDAEPEPDL
jgi:hypothetical protein